MKFAYVALIGAAVAKNGKKKWGKKEEELTEAARKHYSAGAVKKFFGLLGELKENDDAWNANFAKEHPHFEEDMEKLGNWMGQRYGPDAMEYAMSKSVQKSEDHKQKMFQESKELHQVMKDGYELYREFETGKIDYGYGFNEDGSYDEYMSNDSIRHVFEELYQLAKDIRKLAESPMAANQRALERATLKEPSLHRLFQKIQDDIDVHTWGQLETRVKQLMRKVGTELKNCPYFQKMVSILMRMKKVCESEREFSDMGTEEEWTNWWNSKKFTNPFEGMKAPMLI